MRPTMGSGLMKVCKIMGGITVRIGDEPVKYVYDYAADKPVLESDMPLCSERHKLSERAKWLRNPPSNALQCAARACPGSDVCRDPPNADITSKRREHD